MNDDRQNDDRKTPDTPPREQPDDVRNRPFDLTFDLAEAIGRQGADLLKGATPIAARERALYTLEDLLATHLPDTEGSLSRTMLAALGQDAPLLALHYDDPPQALREYLDRILSSASLLTDLVRAADARWGRDYQEHPRFDPPDASDASDAPASPNAPPAPDDPYTHDQVRALLLRLRDDLPPPAR